MFSQGKESERDTGERERENKNNKYTCENLKDGKKEKRL